MHQTAEISLVALVLLTAGIQSRPLNEVSGDGKPTTPDPCPPPRCLHDSKCYADGEEISRGSDGKGWCYGLVCIQGGPLPWDNFNCGPPTTVPPTTATDPPQTTTTPAPPTTLPGCLNEGVRYPVGSEISRGSNEGWCYLRICGEDGQVHEIECDQIKTTHPTTHPTTVIPTTNPTTPPGCFHNGAWYPPGSEISEESDGQGWCYGYYCDDYGQLMVWDNFNCGPSTTTQTRFPPSPTPSPTPTPLGCRHNGRWYPPGSEMSKGSDGKGWCYGSYCDDNGQEVAWDDWNCGPSTTPTPDPTPTPSLALAPKGCLENGKWYPPGSEISRGSDGKSWCFGEYCTHDGKVQLWDDLNCSPKSQPTAPPTTPPKGCYYEGKLHPPDSTFEGSDKRGCRYGAYCDMNGQVTRWEEFNCQL